MAIVEINGTILSQLLHDCTVNNAEGILFGEVVKSLQDEITDDDINERKEDIRIHITKILTCESYYSFSDRTGQVKKNKLQSLLDNKEKKDIIGWFTCRHNSTSRMSFREQALHLKFAEYARKDLDNFLFGLVIPSATDDSDVNSCNFDFRVKKKDYFHSLPLRIINLGQRNNQKKVEQYIPRYVKSTSPLITNSNSVFNEVSSEYHTSLKDLSKMQEEHIMNLNSTLHKEFVDLCNNAANQQLLVAQLEKELKALGICVENGIGSQEDDEKTHDNDRIELKELQHSPRLHRRHNLSSEELLIQLNDEPQIKKKTSLLENVDLSDIEDNDFVCS
ncbi:DgyrCDS10247 [Dimorphilus gyrociliatus]|uniref:DgyrCDS10247 n=1 Tax=Dimorphilus gyrociliatus TaxID=2664684 RepID=A0A7I8VZM9_9ANNE|nr:DgyrCDS10247 [Dimorphilus gyrociliatus]